jgi:predicted ATP-grasp superfamily ATP-dependent carboligase
MRRKRKFSQHSKRKRRRSRKVTIQEHHIRYNPEIKVRVYRGEHGILSRIQWYCRKKVSKGFIKALKMWIQENEAKAVEL